MADPISSVNEFLDAVEECVAPWRGRWVPGTKAWFRGHVDYQWQLNPGLLRNPYLSDAKNFGQRFHYLFKAGAQPFLPGTQPRDALHWMMIAQHHRVPTRLLDWTESAAAALYFAVRPTHDSLDGSVWILDCLWLGKEATGDFKVASNDYLGAHTLAEPGFEGTSPPIPLFPDKIAPRMVAQHSCFSLHGWETDDLQTLANATPAPKPLHEVRIKASAKADIRKKLAMLGVDEAVVYPDLDGLARSLRLRLADDTSGF